ncbi:MAG: aspartate kinase [Eubacterium sp.]|nr:aspartate kinase [Eubacterium sp.]
MKKVVKFGGSSLASAEQFQKVGDIIRADESRVFVVPSAPGKRNSQDTKVTDLLYKIYGMMESNRPYLKVLEQIKIRYAEIIRGLGLKVSLVKEFEEIRKQLEKGAGEDYVISRGEYLNGKIMSAYLGYDFVDAANVIRFNDDGTLDAEETYRLMKAQLEAHPKAVIPGFYGSRKNGTVVTFSRGGSDITGSLVARAVKADIYENWTDVSGFMVADPRIVKDPEVIHTITYEELRELAYMGASVMHEDAIFPVSQVGIPINIRNTNDPEAEGTMIVERTSRVSKYTITGIAGMRGFVALNIAKDKMNTAVGFCRKALTAFEENGVSVEHMPSGIDTMSVIVHQKDFSEKEQQVISRIEELCEPDHLDIESDFALIAVVGRGMKSTRGTAGRLFSALAHAHINIKMIDQGSSELNIIIAVSNDDFENAIRAIYDIFVMAQI